MGSTWGHPWGPQTSQARAPREIAPRAPTKPEAILPSLTPLVFERFLPSLTLWLSPNCSSFRVILIADEIETRYDFITSCMVVPNCSSFTKHANGKTMEYTQLHSLKDSVV